MEGEGEGRETEGEGYSRTPGENDRIDIFNILCNP